MPLNKETKPNHKCVIHVNVIFLVMDSECEFQGNSILVQGIGISSTQLMWILYNWINMSLLKSYEPNKRLYEEAASWSCFPMLWIKINDVWWYDKIQLGYSGFVAIM